MSSVRDAMARVTASLSTGAERRDGQLAMAEAVAAAVDSGRHLAVQAGTGTGKSLAYIVPLALSGKKVVLSTATKALQDQLAKKDLPFAAKHLGDFSFAVLKGRSNYLCRQRAAEISGGAARSLGLEGPDGDGFADQLRRLIAWSSTSETGDRAELEQEPHPRAWAQVSVGPHECPGAHRCPSGWQCFAERARENAARATMVVVNTHLYATHVASGGSLLPDHDVVVFDEAHEMSDIMTGALGVELTAGRLRAAASGARPHLLGADTATADALAEAATALDRVISSHVGRRVHLDADPEIAGIIDLLSGRIEGLLGALRRVESASQDGASDSDRPGGSLARSIVSTSQLLEDVRAIGSAGDDQVAWVERRGDEGKTFRLAPIEVGPLLTQRLWPKVTGILTSATLPASLETDLGLPEHSRNRIELGSPFPYRQRALLYVPLDLPDRRRADAEPAIFDEIAQLATAAGGRTMALFTSRRVMEAAAVALRERVSFEVLVQDEMPKSRLVERFGAEPSTCLVATVSFWQGVDVPGPSCHVVTLDRIPFPRPDEPLTQVRREKAGPRAFQMIDLPRAATLLAQGAGRLMRCSTDAGVVAVLDRRLALASYRHMLLAAMPPMRRTVERDEVLAFLRSLDAGQFQFPGPPVITIS